MFFTFGLLVKLSLQRGIKVEGTRVVEKPFQSLYSNFKPDGLVSSVKLVLR